jgi:hypothetical protein
MALARPSITFNVTPPGGGTTNYAANLAYTGASQTNTISQNFGRQGDTATFVLVDDWAGHAAPNFFIPTLSQVALVDNTISNTLFAGVINTPTLLVDGGNRNEWILQCTDYTFYADNALVQGTFNGLTIDKVVVELTQQANCGINAALISQGGFVAPAPSINTITFNQTQLSTTWRTLASLASSSTPYGWYVDQNRNLHFFDSSTAQSSGATFTTSPTVPGSTTEGHIARDNTFGYEWDGTSIRNRILVQGGNQPVTVPLTGPPTDTWQSNGVQSSWGLRFTVTGTPALTLNGVSTTVALVAAGATSAATWQVAQNANGQWFLLTSRVPKAGTVIRLWYNYLIPITAQVNDLSSQSAYTGPNHGIYTTFIQDTSLITVSMALARAQRERTEYGVAAERATFDTTEDFFGYVRAGQTFGYHNTLVNDTRHGNTWGVNDTFICVTNSVNFGRGGYRTMTITGVRI